MKDVKLVLSVVALEPDGKDAKVVYQTEKIFSGEQVETMKEGRLVSLVIGEASNGVIMKPDSVKPFKDAFIDAPKPKAQRSEVFVPEKKAEKKTVVKKKSSKKKSSGRGK